MHQLTKLDADILAFIRGKEFVTLDDIQKRFPKIATISHRIRLLTTMPNAPVMQQRIYRQDEIGQFISTGTGRYSLTQDGEKALEDYQYEHRLRNRELWIKNAWLPLLTTVAFNLIKAGIEWLLQRG